MRDDALSNNKDGTLRYTDNPLPDDMAKRDSKLPQDHQALDPNSEIDSDQIYHEGIVEAANFDVPDDPAVVDYNPNRNKSPKNLNPTDDDKL